jgi:Mrp family chromosome partitioning ATPase
VRVGDALTLSKKVDGVIVVARMKVVRRQMLTELARQLGAMPIPVLGFVVTAAGDEPDYGYGYGYHSKPYVQDEQVERERSKA